MYETTALKASYNKRDRSNEDYCWNSEIRLWLVWKLVIKIE